MSHEASEGWVERRIRAAMKGEIDALRAAITELTEAVAADRAELDASRAELAEMRARTTGMRAEIADQGADLRAMIRSVGMEISKTAAHAEEGLSALRMMIGDVGAEISKSAANAEEGLNALCAAMDGDERMEALRLRVEGLLAQHRWDMDQLRQAVTALAERLPLGD